MNRKRGGGGRKRKRIEKEGKREERREGGEGTDLLVVIESVRDLFEALQSCYSINVYKLLGCSRSIILK